MGVHDLNSESAKNISPKKKEKKQNDKSVFPENMDKKGFYPVLLHKVLGVFFFLKSL